MLKIGQVLEIKLRDRQGFDVWTSAVVTKYSDSIAIVTLDSYPHVDFSALSSRDDYVVSVNWFSHSLFHVTNGHIAGKLKEQVFGIKIDEASLVRHEYASIEDRLEIPYRTLEKAEYFAIRKTFAKHAPVQTLVPKYLENNDDIPAALLKFLGDINYKLDRILRIIESKDTTPMELNKNTVTSIVGGGYLVTSDAVEGEFYLVKCSLPVYPYREFYALGKGEMMPAGKIGIIFSFMQEEDREELIKFIFERQRTILKAQRNR
ncbi:hypothetical protein [Chrysiogenes arsenatis]|uniref:hypothetical protein n=1 Tax=Chrysiogenes arsenatis TaxID=309797 RepID=UPI0003FF4BCC|nr:hypothetical protein [Chrysiogenes arsenatis]